MGTLPGRAAVLVAAVVTAAVMVGTSPSRAACADGREQVLHLRDHNIDHPVLVYRPPVADGERLPVVYLLHGQPGTPYDVVAAGLVSEAERLARAGHPFVLVAPDGNGHRADTEWADAADDSDALESFLVDRVLPAVEGAHPRTAAYRTLVGFSMGGYGAANIALHHPGVFRSFASVSGYFHIDDPDAVFDRDPAVERANRPDLDADSARGMRVLLREGTHDLPLVRGEAMREAALLRAAGADVDVRVVPGGHEWRLVRDALPAVVTELLPPATAAPDCRGT